MKSGTVSYLSLDFRDLHIGEGKGKGPRAGNGEKVVSKQQMETRRKEEKKVAT